MNYWPLLLWMHDSQLSRASALHFPCRGSVARLPKSRSSCRLIHTASCHRADDLCLCHDVLKKLAFYRAKCSLLKSLRKTFTKLTVWSRCLLVCTLLWRFTVVHFCRMFFLFLNAHPLRVLFQCMKCKQTLCIIVFVTV